MEITLKFTGEESFEAKAALAGQEILLRLDEYREVLRGKAKYGEDEKDEAIYTDFMAHFGELLALLQ